jgi:hypothetical protein
VGEAAGLGSSEADPSEELTEPLIAHVRDLSTGEITVYMGENEYTYRDQQLASRLFRATR